MLDLIFPRACGICGRRLDGNEHTICQQCFNRIDLLHLESNVDDNLMARLLWGHLTPKACFSLMHYRPEGYGTALIHALKYRGDYDMGVALGYMAAMTAQGNLTHVSLPRLGWHADSEGDNADFFSGIELMIPMPLHKRRLRQRGYNQSQAISEGISIATGIKICPNAIVRQRDTPTQTHLSGVARRDNIVGAFALRHPEKVSGKHLLIVDDVMTTGSTISALGQELLKAGNVQLSVLTLALSTERILV